jgi:hypothetical protein
MGGLAHRSHGSGSIIFIYQVIVDEMKFHLSEK